MKLFQEVSQKTKHRLPKRFSACREVTQEVSQKTKHRLPKRFSACREVTQEVSQKTKHRLPKRFSACREVIQEVSQKTLGVLHTMGVPLPPNSSSVRQLVLASSSPRRRELVALLDLSLPVLILSTDADEQTPPDWAPS